MKTKARISPTLWGIAALLVGFAGCGNPQINPDPDAAVPDAEIPMDLEQADTAPPADTAPDPDLTPIKQLVISSSSPLPAAMEGEPYAVQLTTSEGRPPFGWLIRDGALPAGLSLGSGGAISGTPTEIGDFSFTVKVVDDADPPEWATKELSLTVEVAPLQITGDTVYSFFSFKVVVLPMITIIEGLPIPYSAQLQSKGGLRPHSWAETDLPKILQPFFAKAGVPPGLTLDSSGALHGAVATTEDVIQINIPGTAIILRGFFFTAEVEDSQSPADAEDALFLIPTLPL